jgi:hypothetical protein
MTKPRHPRCVHSKAKNLLQPAVVLLLHAEPSPQSEGTSQTSMSLDGIVARPSPLARGSAVSLGGHTARTHASPCLDRIKAPRCYDRIAAQRVSRIPRDISSENSRANMNAVDGTGQDPQTLVAPHRPAVQRTGRINMERLPCCRRGPSRPAAQPQDWPPTTHPPSPLMEGPDNDMCNHLSLQARASRP